MRHVGERLSQFSIPLSIFAATRVVQVSLIAWMNPASSNSSVSDRLLSWDAGWFVRVARDGYPEGYTYSNTGAVEGNGLAFFPGFPFLIRLVHYAMGGSFESAALVAGTVAGAIATLAVYALGVTLYGRGVGVVFATLFCAQPMSVVLSMGYSEGLFVAFTALAFVAARRDLWLVAGLLGLGATLTRPTGAAVALGLSVGAILRFRSAREPAGRWRPVAGATIALLGVPCYLLWVGLRAGSLRAWFDIQTAGWGTTFDGGSSAVDFVTDTLRDSEDFVAISVVFLLIAAVVLAILATLRPVWPPLLAYGLISLILVIGQAGFFHSKPRLMVPDLVILLPVAVALGRAKISTAVPVLLAYTMLGLWYGSYMINIWRFAI